MSMAERERFRNLEWEMYKYPQIQSLKDSILIDRKTSVGIPANYAQTECQFRYCGTAIPFLTVRSTAR